MADRTFTKPIIHYGLAIVIVAIGVALWMQMLHADPPMHYSGLGQSLSTDPAQYTYHAKNKILYGDADPFDYPRWNVYKKSLTSLISLLWLSIAGVSYAASRVVGILLNLGAILMLLFALNKHHRPWLVPVMALLFFANVSLIVYGRLSYLENGLMFFGALLMLVYSRWGAKLSGLIICAIIIAFATLTGKLFGALLLPALLLTDWIRHPTQRLKRFLWSLIGFILAAATLLFALYTDHLPAVYGYFSEQAYGLRGIPEGLSSPWAFVEHLVSYGYSNRLLYLNIDLSLMLVAGALFLAHYSNSGGKLKDLPPLTVLALFWICFVVLGLMPLNYSPLRYALYLIPAIMIFILTMTDSITNRKSQTTRHIRIRNYVFVFIVLWNTLFQLAGVFVYQNAAPIRMLTWILLPAALLITFTLYLLAKTKKLRLTRRTVWITAGTVVVISVAVNAYRIQERIFLAVNYSIEETNDDIRRILGPDAVLSGPYAPVLTIDNHLKSFIHLFGVAEVDSTLFDRFPVTHILTDASNWQVAVSNYPQLDGVHPVSTYWIRDYEVKLYYIADRFSNPIAHQYVLTDYEQASRFYFNKMPDSATVRLIRFAQKEPVSKSAGLMLAEMYFTVGNYPKAAEVLTRLAETYPTDFYLNMQCGRLYQIFAIVNKDNYLLGQAHKYYQLAIEANPFEAGYINRYYAEIMRQMGEKPPIPPGQ